jgi:phospholipid N-methyltransferase
VSGLPWAGFAATRQTRILDAVVASLRPGGWFTTFAYVHAAGWPPGRRFRRLLEARFSEVERSRVVWKNLPPAFVYRCREAGPGSSIGPATGSGPARPPVPSA